MPNLNLAISERPSGSQRPAGAVVFCEEGFIAGEVVGRDQLYAPEGKLFLKGAREPNVAVAGCGDSVSEVIIGTAGGGDPLKFPSGIVFCEKEVAASLIGNVSSSAGMRNHAQKQGIRATEGRLTCE